VSARAVTREQLEVLFRPRSLALIGASDKSPFSHLAYATARRFGAADRTFLVNPRSPVVHRQETVASCADVPGGVDCAYVMVPQALVPGALEEAAAAGARAAVVLSSGYAETGEAGEAHQQALVQLAGKLDVVLLGPNHLGFANIVDGVAACALPDLSTTPGPLALVSQSGALAGLMLKYAAAHAITFSYVVTTGNEAMVAVEDVLDYLVDEPTTRAVAVFGEVIRHPETFLRAVGRLREAGKAVVMLKVGASELSARTAAAHTGALVGDDRVIDAVLRQEGVIRVGQLEELLVTANLAAHTGPWARPGVAIASISGGACDLVADRGAEAGLHLPELAPATLERLAEVVPAFAQAHNPLDVTGAAMLDGTIFGRVVEALAADPEVGIVGAACDLPIAAGHGSLPMSAYESIGAAARAAAVPVVVVESLDRSVTDAGVQMLAELGMTCYLPSLQDAVTAMAKVGWWSERVRALAAVAGTPPVGIEVEVRPGVTLSEEGARQLLVAAGVPVVPGRLVASAEEAVQAAREHGDAAAVKIVSPDILHKSDIGGVLLDVRGDDAVRAAYESVVRAAATEPDAVVEGVLVSPMRRGGVELLVGVVRDPGWGPVLAVGFGGVLVEVLQDAAVLRLPASAADVRDAILGLRGAALLGGVRGAPAADVDELVRVVCRIGALALALGDELESLEVNPLRVAGATCEALDALITWR
jgi:acyl-CoA synthetase (NDP forming)